MTLFRFFIALIFPIVLNHSCNKKQAKTPPRVTKAENACSSIKEKAEAKLATFEIGAMEKNKANPSAMNLTVTGNATQDEGCFGEIPLRVEPQGEASDYLWRMCERDNPTHCIPSTEHQEMARKFRGQLYFEDFGDNMEGRPGVRDFAGKIVRVSTIACSGQDAMGEPLCNTSEVTHNPFEMRASTCTLQADEKIRKFDGYQSRIEGRIFSYAELHVQWSCDIAKKFSNTILSPAYVSIRDAAANICAMKSKFARANFLFNLETIKENISGVVEASQQKESEEGAHLASVPGAAAPQSQTELTKACKSLEATKPVPKMPVDSNISPDPLPVNNNSDALGSSSPSPSISSSPPTKIPDVAVFDPNKDDSLFADVEEGIKDANELETEKIEEAKSQKEKIGTRNLLLGIGIPLILGGLVLGGLQYKTFIGDIWKNKPKLSELKTKYTGFDDHTFKKSEQVKKGIKFGAPIAIAVGALFTIIGTMQLVSEYPEIDSYLDRLQGLGERVERAVKILDDIRLRKEDLRLPVVPTSQ